MAGSPQTPTEVTLAVAIRRYFDVALYLLIFTGFGTLASTGRLDVPTVLLVTLALLFRGYALARRRRVLLSERWTNLLTIACVGFFIADDFVISRAFLGATVHLVLFVMLVRLFSAQKDRDHYLLAVLVLLLLIFVGGGLIFFVLPRVSAGYLNAYTGANDLTSGFSDRVELGRIGQIQQSKTVVMHVRVDSDSAGAFLLKLRGVALNNFDGRNWSNTRDKFNLGRGPDGRFDLWPRNPQPVTGRDVHYRVTMEPFLTEVFFLLATPKSLQGNYRTVSEDT